MLELAKLRDWWKTLPDAKPNTILKKITDGAQSLARYGDIGRPSKIAETRELSIGSAPYVLIYRCYAYIIEIIGVFHTATE